MPESDPRERLKQSIQRQSRRIRQAEHERKSLLSETVYLGTVGLLFVLPILAGAYIGRWLDNHDGDYSAHWILPSITIGVVVGAVNVYFFIRSNYDHKRD